MKSTILYKLVVLASSTALLAACLKPPPSKKELPKVGLPWDPDCAISAPGNNANMPAPEQVELWVTERAGQLCEKAALDHGRCKLIESVGSPYPRVHEEVHWTGREILVWGGCAMVGERLVRAQNGASFDPATNQWAPLSWQDYAEKRVLAAAAGNKPLELVTNDWIPGAVLDAHLLETQGTTMIWGGWVAMERASASAEDCPAGAKQCLRQRFELIPDGVVIIWTGKIQCNIGIGGRPLGGATVRVLTGSLVVEQTETSTDGTCTIDLAADTYTVEISKIGFQTVSYPVTVRRSEVSNVDVELIPAP